MSINLISIKLVWDDKKQCYVKVKEEINPNLRRDIENLEKQTKEKKQK